MKGNVEDGEEAHPLTQDYLEAQGVWVEPERNRTFVKRGRVLYHVLLHLLVLYLAATLWHRKSDIFNCPAVEGVTWSPVQEFVEYEIGGEHALHHDHFSPYSGPPSDEQNQAWKDLIKPTFFNASREELEKAGESLHNAVQLVDGGYMSTISVYHELHCLRQIRFWLYRDTYYPHLTEAQDEYSHEHLDHCLEAIRLSIMCHGNTGLYSFAWDDPTKIKPATKSQAKSVCVKWSSIETWAYSRMVDTDPALIRTARNPEDYQRGY